MKPQHSATFGRLFWYLFAVGLTLLVWYLIVPALARRPGPREPGIDDSYLCPLQDSPAMHSISLPDFRPHIIISDTLSRRRGWSQKSPP